MKLSRRLLWGRAAAWLVAVALICLNATAGTISGTLQTPNGMPIKNGTITFNLTQAGLIIGTGAVVPLTSSCYTSTDGTVVGLPNPLASPIAAVNSGSGTLPGGNYYVEVGFYDSLGHVTLVSPEQVFNASSGGSLIVQPPLSFPAAAVGMDVYIGSSSGTETLQGTTTGTAAFTQSTPLSAGSAVPASNNTLCSIAFNDTIIPYAGYNVSLLSSSGKAYPGYPQAWQLNGGASGTVNISNGAPLWNGTVIYPMPILSQPLNHGPQSIAGPLNMTGYNLVNVGNLGVGTALPAWPIDVENGFINSNLGYGVGGNFGTSGQCLASGGPSGPDTWINCLTGVTTFYQTVATNGTAAPQRNTLNFSTRFGLADSSSPSETTVDLAPTGIAAATYTNPTCTFDIFGRATSCSNGPTIPVTQHIQITTGICTAAGGSFSTCADAVESTWPFAFANTGYGITCFGFNPSNGTGPTGSIAGNISSISKTTTGVLIALQTYTSSGFSFGEVDCIGVL